MTPSTLPKKPVENWEQVRDEWVAAVEGFVRDVESWCAKQDWAVRRDPKRIEEDRLGAYVVPRLLIHTPAGRLVLEPVARYVPGALGVVDLTIMPSYDSLMISRTDAGWQLHSGGPDEAPRPWSEQTFAEAVERLTRSAS
jgi:hypothetical protein